MFLLLLIVLGTANISAQVTIGADNTPHPGAVLDLKTADKGLLLPNVSIADALVFQLGGDKTTAVGMIVYNTNTAILNGQGTGVYVWDGSKWIPVSGGAAPDAGYADTVVGANGTYNTWCFPVSTGLGCWMTDNSREGTPSTTTFPGQTAGARGYYYSMTNAKLMSGSQYTACPRGWSLPSLTLTQSLVNYFNKNYASAADAMHFFPKTVLAGGMGNWAGATWSYWDSINFIWVQGSPISMAYLYLGSDWIVYSNLNVPYQWSVRCVKD